VRFVSLTDAITSLSSVENVRVGFKGMAVLSFISIPLDMTTFSRLRDGSVFISLTWLQAVRSMQNIVERVKDILFMWKTLIKFFNSNFNYSPGDKEAANIIEGIYNPFCFAQRNLF